MPTSSGAGEDICPIREIRMPWNNVVALNTSTEVFLMALSTIYYLFIQISGASKLCGGNYKINETN